LGQRPLGQVKSSESVATMPCHSPISDCYCNCSSWTGNGSNVGIGEIDQVSELKVWKRCYVTYGWCSFYYPTATGISFKSH